MQHELNSNELKALLLSAVDRSRQCSSATAQYNFQFQFKWALDTYATSKICFDSMVNGSRFKKIFAWLFRMVKLCSINFFALSTFPYTEWMKRWIKIGSEIGQIGILWLVNNNNNNDKLYICKSSRAQEWNKWWTVLVNSSPFRRFHFFIYSNS